MTSENVHLDTFPDTVQTAQTQSRKCGGVKGRQLSGLLNEEHPPHQSQHTHHTNNIKSVSQYLLLDPNLCRLEQGALSSEVTKSPIFIVGMVGCNVAAMHCGIIHKILLCLPTSFHPKGSSLCCDRHSCLFGILLPIPKEVSLV